MKQMTVAPKERINVRFKSASEDAPVDIELPLKLMLLGQFDLTQDDIQISERTIYNIHKDNVNTILSQMNIQIDIQLKNKIDSNQETLQINYPIKSLKSFHPDELIQTIPKLRQLYQIRQSLNQIKVPLLNYPKFKQALIEQTKRV